jgi:riboflavin transporter FmnP
MFKLSKEAKSYWCAFGVKILENLASIKVWFFILPFIISTIIMSILVGFHIEFIKESLKAIVENKDLLVPVLEQMKTMTDMFIAWCTFTVSLAGTIIVVREVFKVSKLKAFNEEKKDNTELIEKMNV